MWNAKLKKISSILILFCGICYFKPDNCWAGSGWQIETVTTTDCGYYTSMTLDRDNYPHIACKFGGWASCLIYAQWDGSSWSIESVDVGAYIGNYTSIALDTDNYPHISYYGNSLRYAKWNGSSWEIETVDSGGNQYTSIALDANHYRHISYHSNNDLRYAKWDGVAWSTSTVDSAGDVGEYSSLALDTSGYPHISYYDCTNKALKYAKWNGSSWNIETVDSTGDAGKYTSIALDTDNYPHISYYDSTNGDLKYVKWIGAKWQIQTVDSAGDVGEWTSIALDADGDPHMSYYNHEISNEDDCGDLKYAKWNGSSWNIETVDSTGDAGKYTSIALDTDNYPHISYYENRDLNYAKWTNNNPILSWTGETNYTSDGLDPEIGDTSTTFVYCVEYIDSDNDAPTSGYPKVHIKKGGVEISESPFTMTYVLGNYNTGAIYTYSTTLSAGTDYTYYFEAYDVWNATATGDPTSSVDAPDITDTTIPTYYIKGYVLDESSVGISEVTMTLSGDVSKSTTTETSGYYEFVNLSSGTYTVTATKEGYTFDPVNYTYDPLNEDKTNQNFAGVEEFAPTYFISGYVKDSGGTGISGVTMSLTGADTKSTSTNSSGYYAFSGLTEGNYTVAPTKEGYSFEPSSRGYSPLNSNQSNQNFVETYSPPTYSINGYVLDASSSGINGVTVNLFGDISKSTTTASLGYYEFLNLSSGTYTVTPAKTGWTFDPAKRDYTPLTSNQDNQNFVGSPAPSLGVNPTTLDFGEVKRGESKTLSFQVSNSGSGTLSGTISLDKDWIKVSPTNFNTNSQVVNVTIDNSILNKGEGEYTGTVTVSSNGGNASVTVKLLATCVIVKPHPFRLSSGKALAFWGSGVVPHNTKINIYTLSGNLVKTIEEMDGKNELYWDGTNNWGEKVVPGIYLYTTESPKEKNAGKITVIK